MLNIDASLPKMQVYNLFLAKNLEFLIEKNFYAEKCCMLICFLQNSRV